LLRGPLRADSRLGALAGRVNPSGRERLERSSGRTLCGSLVALLSTDPVEDGARAFGEFGPLGRLGPVAAGLEDPVGEHDLVSGAIGLRAPAGPGRAVAVVSVEDGFDVEGVVAPDGPARGRVRHRSDPDDQVLGWVVGEGGDPVGAGAVQSCVDLGDGGIELLALGGDVSDVLVTSLLVLREVGEALAELALGDDRVFGSALGGGDLRLGVGVGLVVVAPPPPPAGVVEVDLAVSQLLFGLVALPDHLG
jgi:hypothetical protein